MVPKLKGMAANVNVTVLFATRNRHDSLRATLEALVRVRRDGVSAQFVVVDNGSVDGTRAVLEEFLRRLPLTMLHDPVPGKSHALNHALETVEMGEIIAFIDDDVTPDEDWLNAIADCCRRWPSHHVFGGKITPVLSVGGPPPRWAMHDAIQTLAFAKHDLGIQEIEYSADQDPFGCNFWVRRDAISGTRFLEGIGPQPKQRMLGSETQFIRQLRMRGLVPLYSPLPRVAHHIEPQRVTKRAVYHRARQGGRGVVHTRGLPDEGLLQRSRAVWQANRMANVAKAMLDHLLAAAHRTEERRVLETVYASWALSENLEALRVARDRTGATRIGSWLEGNTR